MADELAIYGTFADLKSVKTRSVVQMIIEVPIEQAKQVVDVFGFPQPGAEIPVAVARMNPPVAKPSPAAPEKDTVPFHDHKLSWQAGVRCNDHRFSDFLKGHHASAWEAGDAGQEPEVVAAVVVRYLCGVPSRADLNDDEGAGFTWKSLNAEFEEYAGLTTVAR